MNWKDISIKKGKELYALDSDSYYDKNPEDKVIAQLSIILDKDVEEIEDMSLDEFFSLQKDLKFLSKIENTFSKEITIQGETYYFIDLSKMRAGEFIDLDTYCKEPIDNMSKLMCLLYRKKDEKWSSKLLDEREELFENNISWQDAMGASIFFCLLGLESIKPTKEYSFLDLMMKSLNQKKEDLEVLVNRVQEEKKEQENNSSGS